MTLETVPAVAEDEIGDEWHDYDENPEVAAV